MATSKKAAAAKAAAALAAGSSDPLTPKVTPVAAAAPLTDDEKESFSFAVNVVKLNRAKAHIQQTQPTLKGKDFVAAVKDRYEQIGGLLLEQKLGRRTGKKGTVVNLADEDAE